MSASVIGRVKAGSGKTYEVKWDPSDKNAYVSWAGWTHLGKASNASDAMAKAAAFLYNK